MRQPLPIFMHLRCPERHQRWTVTRSTPRYLATSSASNNSFSLGTPLLIRTLPQTFVPSLGIAAEVTHDTLHTHWLPQFTSCLEGVFSATQRLRGLLSSTEQLCSRTSAGRNGRPVPILWERKKRRYRHWSFPPPKMVQYANHCTSSATSHQSFGVSPLHTSMHFACWTRPTSVVYSEYR